MSRNNDDSVSDIATNFILFLIQKGSMALKPSGSCCEGKNKQTYKQKKLSQGGSGRGRKNIHEKLRQVCSVSLLSRSRELWRRRTSIIPHLTWPIFNALSLQSHIRVILGQQWYYIILLFVMFFFCHYHSDNDKKKHHKEENPSSPNEQRSYAFQGYSSVKRTFFPDLLQPSMVFASVTETMAEYPKKAHCYVSV